MFVFVLGLAILVGAILLKPANPPGVCELYDTSTTSDGSTLHTTHYYVCSYVNPELICGPKQHSAANQSDYWDCHD